jgi:hypothetical protein
VGGVRDRGGIFCCSLRVKYEVEVETLTRIGSRSTERLYSLSLACIAIICHLPMTVPLTRIRSLAGFDSFKRTKKIQKSKST